MSNTFKDRKKTFKNRGAKKHFGFTDGDNGKESGFIDQCTTVKVKGMDFIKYGYPSEMRNRQELKKRSEELILAERLEEVEVFMEETEMNF